jgi:hypothetical protein
MMKFFSDLMQLRNSLRLPHQFDVTPTIPIIIFEVFIVLAVVCLLPILSKHIKKIPLRFFVIFLGVSVFEFFTNPMWLNYKMGAWAYVYQDVSWILIIAWSIMVLSTIVVVDKLFHALKEWYRFGIYLIILTILVLIFEALTIKLGIRHYPFEGKVPIDRYFFFGVPKDALYYVPVCLALMIGFYKYWSFAIDQKNLIPVKKRNWFQCLGISAIAIFLFEIMIDPMAENVNLPRWSYVFHDISFLIMGAWIVIVWLAINFIDKFFIEQNIFNKFIGYLLFIFAFVLPIESWLILNGFVIFNPNVQANFSGFLLPVIKIPVEVAIAIPFYYALIVPFIKYWEIVIYNKELL